MADSFDGLKFTTGFRQYAIDVTQSNSTETLGGPSDRTSVRRQVRSATHSQ